MVVCVGIALTLGFWQLDAWKTRRADAARDLSNVPAVALTTLMTGDSSFPGRSLGRPVNFSGTWLEDATFYIADRYVEDRRGYWVVTPVLVDGDTSAIPVVRGWTAEPASVTPAGEVAVTGWLQATEGSGPFDEDPSDAIVPTMRLASLVEFVDTDLYSAYVVAREVSTSSTTGGGSTVGSSGLEPVTPAAIPEVSGFTALRNLLYAVEWWIFGAFAFFIWYRWCRDTLELLRTVGSDSAEPEV